MFNDFFSTTTAGTKIIVTSTTETQWKSQLTQQQQEWLAQQPSPKNGAYVLLPHSNGGIDKVIIYINSKEDFWHMAALANSLPSGEYMLNPTSETIPAELLCIAWGLGFYKFDKYKSTAGEDETADAAKLVWPQGVSHTETLAWLDSIAMVRDLISTPACDMGPEELADSAKQLSKQHKAKFDITIGKALLKKNFPAIHTVGKAAADEPRLATIHWQASEPKLKLALVGKGVCFDTGGLDLKPSGAMLLMKKDMGGAANVMGLANMIMAMQLPVDLRVYLPIVENAISEQAMRPLDICHTRKGITVEIGNTDAEGRLILSDALTLACEEKPDLVIDMATLTGAARVAMGTEVPALFTNNDEIAQKIQALSFECVDPVWQLPLYKGYRRQLQSSVADISSTGSIPLGGAITAALFLNEFVDNSIDWVHVDMMAYNKTSRAGRPEGGEAASIRAIYCYIKEVVKNVNSNKE